jgi:hypothetical protein
VAGISEFEAGPATIAEGAGKIVGFIGWVAGSVQ